MKMNPTRRQYLATSASGLGTLALASLFRQEGLLGQEQLAHFEKEAASNAWWERLFAV